jgi:hypothetical protein
MAVRNVPLAYEGHNRRVVQPGQYPGFVVDPARMPVIGPLCHFDGHGTLGGEISAAVNGGGGTPAQKFVDQEGPLTACGSSCLKNAASEARPGRRLGAQRLCG